MDDLNGVENLERLNIVSDFNEQGPEVAHLSQTCPVQV